MSDVKDEIDPEFIGVYLYTTTQTNYFLQSIEAGMLEVNGTIPSGSFENFRTYKVDWTPDRLIWYLDGKSLRTLQRSGTYNETTKQF
ncbi:hypothetical protein PISL3812_01130 [Talaromyces islandicus]|uniref:GH16 domain-containing protein n=1 Tax=Talaromyces islandicus TaxID=28573 RepID=A0A0U1LL65_TALIS|nr:hypothetical protein PISL3812_01130 [Talaromyces islandicus]